VGPDGRVPVPDRFDPDDVSIEVVDHELEPPSNAPPARGRFRVERGADGALRLELSPDEAGEEVTFAYDLGSHPIVTPFILPKPGKVLSALIELVSGDAYKVQCPRSDCSSRPGYVTLGSGAGGALEAYNEARFERP